MIRTALRRERPHREPEAGGARAAAAPAIAGLLVGLLGACAAPAPEPPAAPMETTVPTRTPELREASGVVARARRLNVGVAVFDPGLDLPAAGPGEVFPELRRAEGRYLAYLLRDTLERSGQWGAVRVLPTADATAELQLSAAIRRSDGVLLSLDVTAVDARGERWLERTYSARADEARYAQAARQDPFQPLFNQVANDLAAARDARSLAELSRLGELAALRYAAALAPGTFGPYLGEDEAGRLRARRLPARGDPALERILRIRESEYLFADTLDAHYARLFEAMRVNYTLWRKLSREEIVALARYRRSTARERRDDGSLRAMMRRYGDFRELKLQEAALREAASTLETILEPSVVAVEGTEVRLEGSLEARYAQWRALLARIQAAETGLP